LRKALIGQVGAVGAGSMPFVQPQPVRDQRQHQQTEPALGGPIGVGIVSHDVSSCFPVIDLVERVRRREERRNG